jgi:Flp pilus assembly protein TadD
MLTAVAALVLVAASLSLPASVLAETAEEYYILGRQAVSPGEAISYFDQAVRTDPEFAPAYHDRGVAYQQLGEIRKAVRDFDEALRLSDQNVSAYYNRGVCYTITKVYKRAIADYEKAIELAPEDPRPYNNLAYIYAVSEDMKFRDPKLAVEYAEKAVELSGESNAAYMDTLAQAYFTAGKTQEAVEWAEKATTLQPDERRYEERLREYRKALGS